MIFKQVQIEKFLKKPDTSVRAVLVYGANEGLVGEYVKKLVLSVAADLYDPFSVVYLNCSDVNADSGTLFAEYASQSLMGDRRVLVIRDADNNLTKILKTLFETVHSDTLLVISAGALAKKASLVTLAEEREDMAAIACYEDRDEDIFSTARSKFIENGLVINNEALQLLCSRLSNDRKTNLGEIEKLITYMGDKKDVSIDDIQRVISDQSASNSDDVCCFAASGYSFKAIKAFQKLLNEGNELVGIVRSLTYHFTKLLTVKSYVEGGESLDKAMFKLTPRVIFFRETTFKKQVSIWNRDKLFSALSLLYKCERDCKTTNMPAEDIVSYAILQIASEANRLNRGA